MYAICFIGFVVLTNFGLGLAKGAGSTPSSAKVEQWDGSAWREVGDLSTARAQSNANGGSYLSGLVTGNTPVANTVEEWTIGQNVKVITD